MKKIIIVALIMLLSIIPVSALHEVNNGTLTIFNTSNVKYSADYLFPIENIICDSAVCIKCSIKIISAPDDYELDYIIRYAHNTSDYKESLYTIKQETVSTYWGLQRNHVRSLLINGVEVGSYNLSTTLGMGKPNYFKFDSVDHTVEYGNKKIQGQTIAFTQMNCDDQHNITSAREGVFKMKFSTLEAGYNTDGNLVLNDNDVSLKLSGLTGLFLNTVRKIPLNIGESLYNVLYKPLLIVQYTFNFSFTFIDIIINDWWYMLLLLEIACIIPALQYNSYPDIVGHYINNHITIIMFVYHKIIIPLVNKILQLIATIKP